MSTRQGIKDDIMKTSRLLLAATTLLTFVASPLLAAEPGTWKLRAGVGTVAPESNNLTTDLGGDTLVIDVDDGTALTLSATYMFTEHWAFDILASSPFSHDITATVIASVDPGFSTNPVKIAETKHLPPTFSVQYHFMPDGQFQPFVGLGVNWTTFFDTKVDPALAAGGITGLDLDDSFGIAAQIGADLMLSDRWLVNLDVRWINIETDAALSGEAFAPATKVDIGTVTIDPWVYAVNVGYSF
jgi:outer membrane protein